MKRSLKRLMRKFVVWLSCLITFFAGISLAPISVFAENQFGFNSPFPGKDPLNYVTSEFGPRGSSYHRGIDIAWSGIEGTAIHAVKSGTVYQKGNDGDGTGWGNWVRINHGNGIHTLYAHMKYSSTVSVGQQVSSGQVIGYVGQTGDATGPHLHFEVYKDGTRVNPRPYLEGVNGSSNEGYLDSVSDGIIQGWVWSPDAPNTSINANIDILNASGSTVYSTEVNANIYRSDLVAAGKGNGYHGFSYSMNWSALPQGEYTIEVSAGFTSIGSLSYYNSIYKEGNLESVDGSSIQGWAWSSALPDSPINVHLYIKNSSGDTSFIGNAVASNYRGDLSAAGKGNGYHGFNYSMNWAAVPQGDYTIEAYAVDGSGYNPKIGTLSYHNSIYKQGNLESVDSSSIQGWAWSSALPNSPINVHLYIKNTSGETVFIGNAIAGNYRGDLSAAGKGNGYHGFNYSMDWGSLPKDKYTIDAYAVDGSGFNPKIGTLTYNNG